jgi:hypothetical protein
MLQFASTLHLLLQSPPGTSNSSRQLLEPLEPLGLVERLASQDLDPFFEAIAAVWAKGTPESLVIANDLALKCVELVDLSAAAALERTRVHGSRGGDQSMVEQEESFLARIRAFGESRTRFVELVRREGGQEPADLSTLSPRPPLG